MESRQTQWDSLFIKFAADVANMSHAVRLKVGAVAVRDKRVIAIGYNGTPSGEDNCCEELVPYNGDGMEPDYDVHAHREWRDGKSWVSVTKSNVIHAEDNLIRFANKNSINLGDCTLYITHSPCPPCGYKIIGAGFKRIVFEKYYRIVSDLSMLEKIGIKVEQWK